MNILTPLRKLGLDDHEAVLAMQSAIPAGWRRPTGARSFEILEGDRVFGSVALNSAFKMKSFEVPADVWERTRGVIESDVRTTTSTVAPVTLFAHRRVKGYARVEGWLQLRPIAEVVEDRTGHPPWLRDVPGDQPPSPFVLEVVVRASSLPLLHAYRHTRDLQEAIWLVTALLDVPVFQYRGSYTYAAIDGKTVVALRGAPGGPPLVESGQFSDVSGLVPLKVVDHNDYYSQLGLGEPELRVPNLASLSSRFRALDANRRSRFLRASACLSDAADPTLSRGQQVMASVRAIESLLDEAARCPTCKNHVGIADNFKRFIADFAKPSDAVRKLYESLYVARSELTHGAWHYDVDEPFFGIHDDSYITRLAAWVAAKRGVVNWLLAQ